MSILDIIGNTPLLDLTDLFPGRSRITVKAKAEWRNPGGSLKDRPVKRMLTRAIESGRLTRDKIILDSSSGNAGIAYAMLGTALGYRVQLVIPGNASNERKQRIRSHGADIIETDPLEGYDEALRYVHHLYESHPEKYFFCDQYANDDNWLAHYETTAEEMIVQADGEITHFVGSVGTGGSITGIGRRLKNKYSNVQIIGVRPEVWPGVEGLKPLGSPGDIVPKIFDESIIDHWVDVTADEAKEWCGKMARVGLFVGQSSGAYLAGVSKVVENLGSGKIITLLNDLGDRYFSTGLWKENSQLTNIHAPQFIHQPEAELIINKVNSLQVTP